MKRRTLIVGAAGLAGLGLTGWLAWRESAYKAPGANRQQGASASESQAQVFFEADLPDLGGKVVPMQSWFGQPLVVNFWASWCAPCVREMPLLDAIATQMQDVKVIGLAVDSRDNVESFLKKVPVSFPVYIAGHGGIDLTRRLGNTLGGLPFTVLIGADGQMVSTVQGEVQADALRAEISEMLVR